MAIRDYQLPGEPDTRSKRYHNREAPNWQLMIRKRQAARLFALGVSTKVIAEKLGLSHSTVLRYNSDPSFKELVTKNMERMEEKLDEHIGEALIEAEAEAVETMRGLLQSEDDEVKFKAAQSLLDRGGQRGKAAERQQIATLTLSGPVDEAVGRALADPGIRALLKSRPDLARRLSSGEEVTVEEAEVEAEFE